MKHLLLLFIAGLCICPFAYNQIKVSDQGKVAIGSLSNPTSMLELADQKWIRINPKTGSGGVLFYHSGTSTAENIQYGGKIFYEGSTNLLRIGTMENNTFKNGLNISRTNGNIGLGCNPDNNFKLKVMGNSFLDGQFEIGSTGFPSPTIKINNSYTEIYALLKDIPGVPTGDLGRMNQKWGSIISEEITVYNFYNMSDERQKENIKNISLAGSKLMSLRPVVFDYKPYPVPAESEYKERIEQYNERRKNHTGFLAQEVMTVLPEAVKYDKENDVYLVDYISIIPLMVKTMQEQQAQIDELRTQIQDIKTGVKL